MKSFEEMSRNVLDRRDEEIRLAQKRQKKRRAIIAGIIAPVCAALLIVGGVSAAGFLRPSVPTEPITPAQSGVQYSDNNSGKPLASVNSVSSTQDNDINIDITEKTDASTVIPDNNAAHTCPVGETCPVCGKYTPPSGGQTLTANIELKPDQLRSWYKLDIDQLKGKGWYCTSDSGKIHLSCFDDGHINDFCELTKSNEQNRTTIQFTRNDAPMIHHLPNIIDEKHYTLSIDGCEVSVSEHYSSCDDVYIFAGFELNGTYYSVNRSIGGGTYFPKDGAEPIEDVKAAISDVISAAKGLENTPDLTFPIRDNDIPSQNNTGSHITKDYQTEDEYLEEHSGNNGNGSHHALCRNGESCPNYPNCTLGENCPHTPTSAGGHHSSNHHEHH